MLKSWLIDGILAGCMVSIGGTVLLSCDNRYLGALLFCIALLAICYFGFNLYTGKVGFLLADHSAETLKLTYAGLLGNFLGTLLFGLLIAAALPQLREAALAACEKRLTQLPMQTLLRGCFCGLLMYLAVESFRRKEEIPAPGRILMVFLCVMVFILSGFEHCVADMYYFSVAGMWTKETLLRTLWMTLGNSLGGFLLPLLGRR